MKNLVFSYVFIVCLLIGACSKPSSANVRLADRLSSDTRMRFDMAYHEAIKQNLAGNYDVSFELFNYCLSVDSTIAEVYDYLAAYNYELKDEATAAAYSRKAMRLSPDNENFAENYGRSLITQKRYKEAAEVFQGIVDRNHYRTDLLDILVSLYIFLDDKEAVLRAIDKMETLGGSTESTTLTKMQIYQSLGDKERELLTLQQFVEQHPYEPNYRVMLGNWYMNNDSGDLAFNEFQKVLQQEPNNVDARTSIVEYYQTQGQDSVAEKMLLDLALDEKMATDVRLQSVRELISIHEKQMRDSTEMLSLLDGMIEKSPKEIDFLLMKGSYMTLKRMPKDSIVALNRRVLSIAPDYSPVRFLLVQQLWIDEDLDEVIKVSRQGIEYNPEEMAYYYFLGLALYQQDNLDGALDAMKRGVSQINSDTNEALASDLFLIMGDILHKKNNDAEAFVAYDSCLKWKPDNYGCLNNYAYYLSLRKENLETAEAMSRKTIEAEPTNATFLDTYAWILFLQGRYEEARAYIDRVDETSDVSGVIIEHIGDIYAQCGLLERALSYWERALEQDNSNEMLNRKIKERKYIESR